MVVKVISLETCSWFANDNNNYDNHDTGHFTIEIINP